MTMRDWVNLLGLKKMGRTTQEAASFPVWGLGQYVKQKERWTPAFMTVLSAS